LECTIIISKVVESYIASARVNVNTTTCTSGAICEISSACKCTRTTEIPGTVVGYVCTAVLAAVLFKVTVPLFVKAPLVF